jgi:hypothetical protein
MKFLRKLNEIVISIVLTVAYGIAFGLAKILTLVTPPTSVSSDSYWIPEKQKTTNDHQSPY